MNLSLLSPFLANYKNDVGYYFDTFTLGIIEVTGQNAGKFLQNQCTINVLSLGIQQVQLSAICNLQGRVVSLFYLLKKEEAFYLIIAKELIAPTLRWLKKYAVFHKINIQDVSKTYFLCGALQGARTEYHYHMNDKLGFILAPNNYSLAADFLSNHEWSKLLMSQHYPRLSVNQLGNYLPFELGLLALGAIDFDKGCYIGQEIIARMHYRSKRQFIIKFAKIACGNSPLGADILDENEKVIGSVIDAIFDDNAYLTLLSMKDKETEPLFLLQERRYDIHVLSQGKIT